MKRNRQQPRGPQLENLTHLFQQGLMAEAEQLAKTLTASFPLHGFAWKVLGALCLESKNYTDGLRAAARAVELLPDDAAAFNNLGSIYLRLERFDEAELNFRKALAIAPDYAKALFNLASLLRFKRKLQESEDCCRRALLVDPLYTNAHVALGDALELQNRLPEAQASYKAALAISPDMAALHTDLLHLLSLDVQVEPGQLFAEHQAFGDHFEAPFRGQYPQHTNTKDPERALQIGFVTGDLNNHALANFLEPLFSHLARKPTLTLHVYYTSKVEDAITQRFKGYLVNWNAVAPLNDAELAQKIAADHIDVLIDLAGHTALNRLLTFARKPAPVQASWLGYLGTTGLQAMDYYVCDPFWITPGQLDWQLVEKPAYLPAAIVFQPNPAAPAINELPALTNNRVTFGSFNRHNKINDAVIVLWSMLMRSVAPSRMVLGAIPPEFQEGMIQRFEQEGIERGRLTFFPRATQTDYLALHHQVDFCLDTFPHSGGATTAHAAWMGVPTLCLVGETPASRFGATEMHHLSLDGFISDSIEDFFKKGCYWAANTAELSAIRNGMRSRFQSSALGQYQRFSDNFEAMLRAMWFRWCNDLPPAPLTIEPMTQSAGPSSRTTLLEPTAQELEMLRLSYHQQHYKDAEALARRLVSEYPEHGFAWKVLGAIYQAQERYEDSLRASRHAVALAPDDAASHNNLGMALLCLERIEEAESSFKKALAIAPDYAKALGNLGQLFWLQGNLHEAETCWRNALKTSPRYANAHIGLGDTLAAQGKESEAQANYYHAALANEPNWALAFSDALHLLSNDVLVAPNHLFAEHLVFGELFESPLRANWPAHSNAKDPARCLQIGFVSGDLCDHALSNFFEPAFEFLAQKQTLSLHAYYTHTREDRVTQRLRKHFAHWHAVAGLSDVDLADRIHADDIDILIDLSGHSGKNRLLAFARKPAPIQASWLGYLGTTGLQAMDYYLCDRFWITPGELDWQFTEKPAFLPAAVVFQPSEFAPTVNSLPALANGVITFGSFNRHNKINDSVVALWSMLLRDIPDARMVLGAIPLDSQDKLVQNFAQNGVAQSRLLFYPRSNWSDYLALHHQVDFCLDTFPFGGGATTAHAAWMGVPTLCLAGETPASRLGATEMQHLGLDEFIAGSIDDFVNRGKYWAEHVTELSALRQGMRLRFAESALGQYATFASNFEAMLRTMWHRWCDNLPPAPIFIDNVPTGTHTIAVQGGLEPSANQLATLSSLHDSRRYQEAEPLARRLISEYPEHGFAWKILGSVLHALGRLDESLALQKQVVALRPQDHEAHFNLACELHQQGQLDDSVRSYINALSLQPNNAHAFNNLGNIFKTMGLAPQAEQYCRQALALQPDMANAHNNLGNALHAQGKLVEAQACYRQALTLKPDWPDAYNNLAITLKDQGLWSDAKDNFRRALQLRPDWAAAHSNLLYCLSHDVQTEPQELHAQHMAFGKDHEALLMAGWPLHSNTKDPARPLHIGFVSADFYDHALTNFLEPVFERLALSPRLILHAYYTHIYEDQVTQRMRAHFAHWNKVASLNDAELADRIRNDGIDLLIDLTGHTAHNRLLAFARKPAPVQASWLGYLGTTGLQAMDYYLCDTFWVLPGELDWQFSEKMAYLPSAVQFQPSELSPPVNSLPALSQGFVTLGSFNRPNKLNESVIVLWSMLLKRLPNARMLLGGMPWDSEETLRHYFANEGISQDRLVFYPRSNLTDYLALHNQVDFCLDTFPYGGGATTAHAAWMGVPTLALAGESPPSRFGSAITHQLGLDGFIATSIDDFLEKGCRWADNVSELATVRQGLRNRFRASALGQPGQLADNMETMLRMMWQRWCDGLPPAALEVKSDACPPTATNNSTSWEPDEATIEKLIDLYNSQQYPEATAVAKELIKAFPAHAIAWKILGSIYQAQERYAASLTFTRRAIELTPNDATSYNNMGVALMTLERLGEAESSFRQAIAIDPNYGKAQVNLGAILQRQGQLMEAQACCARAIAIDPSDASAHIGLGNSLEAQGRLSEAQASYYRADMAHEPRKAVAHSNVLYLMTHDVLVEPRHLIEEHMDFGSAFEVPLRAGWRAHTNNKDPARRLKIGFVSGDLCNHALTLFLEPAFKALSTRPLLELHAYATRMEEDETTKRLRWYFAAWHAVTDLTSEQLAEKIRGDGIDILIDLSGHTARNRLLTFALKPAPIQVGWVGYLGTSGMKAMDYYLCDAHWLPEGQHEWQFTEQLAYLPSSVIFAPNAHAPQVNPLPQTRNGYVTFGSFNRVSKINDAVLVLWAMLMQCVPGSRLLMGGIEEGSRSAIQMTLAAQGIGAERLTFFARQGMGEYMALHHQVDICLDTYPHGGGATTAHAAWMGVPTLCLTGETVASRFGAALMHHLDLGAFVATDIEGYVEAGAQWAQQPEQLAEIRAGLRARFFASRLGQHQSFALDVEHSLRAMWTHWCSGQGAPPQGLSRPSSPTDALKPVEQVRVVSASQLSEPEFWASSALGQSLREHMARDPRLSLSVACSNRRGLSEIFNNAIAEHPNSVLVFVHDDVWIDEPFFVDTVLAGLQQFDVIGVAGNRRMLPGQPAWPFVDLKFTWDAKANLSGRVAHGKDRNGQVTVYGPTPAPCKLLDGVFMAIRCSTLKDRQVNFDAQFDFHFYDLDFCRSASLAGLRLGSWPVALTHQSGGAFGTSAWQQKYALYAAKWGEPAQPIGETAMRTQDTPGAASADPVAEALAAAAEFEATEQFDYAIKVYEEILKLDSSHGETLYRLGKVAQRLNAYPQAAQHLQSAVQSDPSSERYWLGFIHHLMMTQEPDVVRDSIELGQDHGLTEETAVVLLTILASDTHAKAKKRAAICGDMADGNAGQTTVKFCPVCSNDLAVFLPLSANYQRAYAQFNYAHPIDRYETLNLLEYACPHCTASDRDRLMASYFLHNSAAGQGSASRRILEIAPSRPLGHLLRSHSTEYRSADLFDPSAMDRVDITDMNIYPEERFDWVICSHVLEHVMDDAAALREIHRILAPGGKAMLLVPIPLDLRTTDELFAGEDASEAERVRRFGQNDHIRMYSKQGFAQRIRTAGFDLTLVDQAYFSAGTFDVLGLQESACLYIAVKAAV